MALYRPKGSRVWVMDFMIHGQRVRESTGMTSKTRAREVHNKRRQAIRDGMAGLRRQDTPKLLPVALKEFVQQKLENATTTTASVSQNQDEDLKERQEETLKGRQERFVTAQLHLLPFFGKKLLVDIEARDIARYQNTRLAEGAANATVNREVEVIRQLLRKHGLWARISPDVKMLPVPLDAGRAISPEEERVLLLECSRSVSRILLPFVVVAIETGSRFDPIRRLRWKDIDLEQGYVKFIKDKTKAGSGRVVPLSKRACAALQLWELQFPSRQPNHYVFPSEKRLRIVSNGSAAWVITCIPTRPIRSIRTAWLSAKRRARRHCRSCGKGLLAELPKPSVGFRCTECSFETNELPEGLVRLRMHDLRHTAVSRMIAAGIPLPMIGKIVGWSASTLALMIARYGHFGIEDMRNAVNAISGLDSHQWALPVPQATDGAGPATTTSSGGAALVARANWLSGIRPKYDRVALYELVWKYPLVIVAKRFGVSDVAIRKACVRLGIPLPGRGYWAKLAANKPVPARPPLPPLPDFTDATEPSSGTPAPTRRPAPDSPRSMSESVRRVGEG